MADNVTPLGAAGAAARQATAPPAASAEAPDSGAHYDIVPGIFELLLDPNMNYSSGCYPAGDEDLEAAQEAKMAGIARFVELKPGARVLDIGCGWSGPALYFAEHYDCHVTGVTLSEAQRDYGLAWARRRGLEDRLTVDLHDVMALPYANESFDHVMFLESIIHMPEKAAIFARCHELLVDGGHVFIQESCYDRGSQRAKYRSDRGFGTVDQAFGYIMDLVSGGEMLCRLEEAGLVPKHLVDISADYVKTLTQWLGNLDHHAEAMRAISERAYTMLRRYLMIALATYRSGHTVCPQITARKPPY